MLLSLEIPTAGDKQVVAAGLIVVTIEAITAGVASVPSPIGVPEADWFWHQYIPFSSEVTADDTALGSLVARVDIDTKAMRKIKPNQGVVMALDLADLGGTATVSVVGGYRMLLAK